jgi:hypothetical protein
VMAGAAGLGASAGLADNSSPGATAGAADTVIAGGSGRTSSTISEAHATIGPVEPRGRPRLHPGLVPSGFITAS